MDNETDAKTEAIILHYLTRAREGAQREAEAFNARGMLYSGMFGQKLIDIFLAELRPCLTELADSYASRDTPPSALRFAARAVLERVTGSFGATVTKLLPSVDDGSRQWQRYEQSADIYQREASQHLDAELSKRAKEVSPRVAKVIVPLVSGLGGAVMGAIIGAVVTYRLACK